MRVYVQVFFKKLLPKEKRKSEKDWEREISSKFEISDTVSEKA